MRKKIHPTSKICADPQLFFLLINPQYMYGIRVNSSAVDSPNNSLIKQKRKQGHNRLGWGGGGGGTISSYSKLNFES